MFNKAMRREGRFWGRRAAAIWGLLFGSLNLRRPDSAAQTGNIAVHDIGFSPKSPYSARGPAPS